MYREAGIVGKSQIEGIMTSTAATANRVYVISVNDGGKIMHEKLILKVT